MRMSRALAVGLGGLVVAGVAPRAPGVPVSSPVQPITTSCTDRVGTHAVRRPSFVRRIATGETGFHQIITDVPDR